MNSKLIRALKLSGIVLCAIVFITLAIVIYYHRVEPLWIDAQIRDFSYSIRGKKFGFMFWIFRFITEFGNLFLIILLIGIIAFMTKLDFRFFLVLFGIMLSVILNVGMKDLYSRERPFESLRWMAEDSTSFPSGHSTAAGFLYTYIIYMVYHTNFKKWQKRTLYIVCGVMIPLIMFSRLILGVHYFTDVVAGCATGIMVSCLCMLLYRYCLNNQILTTGLLDRRKKKEN